MWKTVPKVLGGVRPPPVLCSPMAAGAKLCFPPPICRGGGEECWGQRVVVVINGDHRSLSIGVRGPPAPPCHNEREE